MAATAEEVREVTFAKMKPEVSVEGKEGTVTYPKELYAENVDAKKVEAALKELKEFNTNAVKMVAADTKELFKKHKDLNEVIVKYPAGIHKSDVATVTVKRPELKSVAGAKHIVPTFALKTPDYGIPAKATIKKIKAAMKEDIDAIA